MNRSARRLPWQLLTLALVGTVMLAGCTRSATEAPLPAEPAADQPVTEPQTAVDVDATMQALLSTGLTATAELQESIATPVPGGGGGETPQPADVTVMPAEGAVATNTPVPAAIQPTPSGPFTYTVKSGDWIYQIARTFGVDPNDIIAANPGINPHMIQPGQQITIPAAKIPAPGSGDTGQTTYIVQPGDNLFRIALRNNMTYQSLAAANGLLPPYTVYPGQVLVIPPG